jgi:hypothetical protein
MAEKNPPRSNWMRQLIGGLVVAVLAAGSAPWWWTEIKAVLNLNPPPETEQGNEDAAIDAATMAAARDYEFIQAVYETSKNDRLTCAGARGLIEKLRPYLGKPQQVPAEVAYTIVYPIPSEDASVGDVALDRITRIQNVRAECFNR